MSIRINSTKPKFMYELPIDNDLLTAIFKVKQW